jgi:hypothetical protein
MAEITTIVNSVKRRRPDAPDGKRLRLTPSLLIPRRKNR